MDLLFKIILSAILFNLSFFLIDSLGFLTFFFWVPLFLVFKKDEISGFNIGLIWGSLTFSVHLIWLLILLLTKSEASSCLAVTLYLILVCYAAFITGCFSYLISKFIKIFNNFFVKLGTFFIGLFLYFHFLINYSLIIWGRLEGYPFINPLIPLARYKIFIFLFSLITNFWSGVLDNIFDLNKLKQTKIFYLKPPNIKGKGEDNPHSYGQQIYHSLSDLNLFKYQNKFKNLIVVAPESTFPFPINKHKDQIEFWSNVLPENAYFFLGTQRSKNQKTYQSVVILNKSLIINFYDKTHLMPFTEDLNTFWGSFTWANSLFLFGKNKLNTYSKNMEYKNLFYVDDFYILPQICSEFFFNLNNSLSREFTEKPIIIFLFVNDSWFVNYFRKIMQNLVYLKTLINELQILYVTYEKYELITVKIA